MKKTMINIVEELGPTTEQKKNYCTNRDLDGKKYCLCTTHETCEGCGFYSFNLIGQANIISEAYSRMEEENAAINEAFREMTKAVTVISSAVESLHSMAREMRESFSEEEKKQIPSENKRLCKEIIAEARKIVRAGGNAKFVTMGDMQK